MIDVARGRGIEVDDKKLSRLLGVPVVPIVARSGFGKKALMDAVETVAESPLPQPAGFLWLVTWKPRSKRWKKKITGRIFCTNLYPSRWIAIKYLENDEQILEKGSSHL